MEKKKYTNPNKYIISKGKFIRNFEDLYKNIKDPWCQTENFANDEQYIFCLTGFINYLNTKKKKYSVLDIGAGSGILQKYLSKKFKYTGTDIHKKSKKNVMYDDINIFNKSFVNKFDVIFCLKTIYYVSDNIYKVIKNIKKYLRKNGFLIISYNLKKNSFSNKWLTDLQLQKILKKKFKEKYTIEINRNMYMKKNKEKLTLFVFKK